MSFFSRLKLALSILFGGQLPAPALPSPQPQPTLPPPPQPPPAEPTHEAALFLLGLLQREGRLLDFLQEDISGFGDADVGAAARLVHQGCAKVLASYLPVAPVAQELEGAAIDVPKGFDANRFRLTGNVSGLGPWKGQLKHRGWVATKVALPQLPSAVDLKVLAPAEVELP